MVDREQFASRMCCRKRSDLNLLLEKYIPAAQESVIGVITQKIGEGYRVDIGSAHFASLDSLAFEGATKRNKPNLKVGFIFRHNVF